MRSVWPLLIIITAACTQSPQDKQAQQIRATGAEQGDSLKRRAETRARPLDEQAQALRSEAKQAGGYDGKLLDVQADAQEKQAKLIREQAARQAAAAEEAADARVKELKSR